MTSLPSRAIASAAAPAVAQRRHVRDQRVGGIDPELRLRRPCRRAATQATPAPCASGSAAWPPAAACRSAPRAAAHTRRSRPRTGRSSPPCTSHVVVATSSRNQRSWVTTSSAADRAQPLEVRGQPGDALDVEMVGGLVERQDVAVGDQQRGQRHPAALTAAQSRRPRLSRDSASRCSTTRAGAGSAAHTWSGLPPTTTSRRSSPVEVVGLVADAHRQTPRRVTRPESGAGRRSAPQQGGLAVAVAADDADASPSLTPRLTESSSVRVG